jgi:hypothetical protein
MNTTDDRMTYPELRQLVVLNALTREYDARTNAAMLSELDRMERHGEPVPGFATLVERAKARLDGRAKARLDGRAKARLDGPEPELETAP